MNNKKARGLNGVVFLVFARIFVRSTVVYQSVRSTRERNFRKKFQQLVQNDKIESVEVNQNKAFRRGAWRYAEGR